MCWQAASVCACACVHVLGCPGARSRTWTPRASPDHSGCGAPRSGGLRYAGRRPARVVRPRRSRAFHLFNPLSPHLVPEELVHVHPAARAAGVDDDGILPAGRLGRGGWGAQRRGPGCRRSADLERRMRPSSRLLRLLRLCAYIRSTICGAVATTCSAAARSRGGEGRTSGAREQRVQRERRCTGQERNPWVRAPRAHRCTRVEYCQAY